MSNFDNILTKDFLEREYVELRKSKSQIAKEVKCSNNRIKEKLEEFKINREIRGSIDYSNIKKIEANGFKVVGEYKGCHHNIDVICPHCDKQFSGYANHLVYGRTKSCGCQSEQGKSSWTGYKSISGKQFWTIEANAKKCGYGNKDKIRCEFFLSIEDIWNQYIKQDRKCIYTKLPLFWDCSNIRGNASVDRINSDKDYTIDNIQIIHKYVNIMKQAFSHDFFIYISSLVGNNNFDENNFLENEKQSLILNMRQYEEKY
jgi:hypothetical protein